MEAFELHRHRTALRRVDLSRPVTAALRDGLLPPTATFFDYGCGHGDDVGRLEKKGYRCSGWDPVHRAHVAKAEADVVNLGYVVNVIENPREREDTLREAYRHARKVLVVSARLNTEVRSPHFGQMADGIVTSRGTFQKFYDQQELRDWIDMTLGERSVPAAPGVFYVFRSASERESFLAARFRARHTAPRVRRSDEIYDANRDILEPLAQFLSDRGRLPDPSELDVVPSIEDRVGSLSRAFSIIERVTGVEDWRRVREGRSQELLIYLALVRFYGRPKASELPLDLRLDVKAFFGSYSSACQQADKLLFSAGNLAAVDQACRTSPIGKAAGPALYVHGSALALLSAVLRVYEGCARTYLGSVDEANVVKLHRDEPKVSYLAYPEFETDPHPALAYSLTVHLQTFRLRETEYSGRANPPVLHRKEEFVAHDHPLREKFSRLTRQEERHGLYEEPTRIGHRTQWGELLQRRGLQLHGHRLIRSKSQAPDREDLGEPT